jgi:malonyl-CoA O-methyltransferase
LVKANVKRHFSKSAVTYDENASLQRQIEDRLIGKVTAADLKPAKILDIGAGTGSGAKKLRAVYPDSKVFACDIAHGMMKYAKGPDSDERDGLFFLTADMESLPFKGDTFDIVYSSAAAHWLVEPQDLFFDAKRILKGDGVFCFSTFGPYTLYELNKSFDDAYKESNKEPSEHVNRFTPFEEVILKLRRAGFDDIKAEVEEKKITYPKVIDLLKSLKAIGSHRTDTSSGYLGREFLKRVFDIYEKNFKENNDIFATYIVYYFVCRVKNE